MLGTLQGVAPVLPEHSPETSLAGCIGKAKGSLLDEVGVHFLVQYLEGVWLNSNRLIFQSALKPHQNPEYLPSMVALEHTMQEGAFLVVGSSIEGN
jgi:hypothetical protein